jgi:hypothetical protein
MSNHPIQRQFCYKGLVILLMCFSFCAGIPQSAFSAQPIIIDHTGTDIRRLPQSAIEQEKIRVTS